MGKQYTSAAANNISTRYVLFKQRKHGKFLYGLNQSSFMKVSVGIFALDNTDFGLWNNQAIFIIGVVSNLHRRGNAKRETPHHSPSFVRLSDHVLICQWVCVVHTKHSPSLFFPSNSHFRPSTIQLYTQQSAQNLLAIHWNFCGLFTTAHHIISCWTTQTIRQHVNRHLVKPFSSFLILTLVFLPSPFFMHTRYDLETSVTK